MALIWGASIEQLQAIFIDSYGNFLPDGLIVSVYPANAPILPAYLIDYSVIGAYPNVSGHGIASFYNIYPNTNYQIVFTGTDTATAPVGVYTLNIPTYTSPATIQIGTPIVYSNGKQDFVSTINITNPSLITSEMLGDLPDNYTRSQNSNVFALAYGTGYEFERLKQTLLQLEANNYIYSPEIQSQTLAIDGVGLYLIEFTVPFVTPPLNVTIAGSNYTDVFIEYTDNFSMIVNVQTEITDVLSWTAYGYVGASSTEELGDSLYQNFGALFNFPRLGDSAINDTGVTPYEKVNTFIVAEQLYPVQSNQGQAFTLGSYTNNANPYYPTFNAPPVGVNFLKGLIRPTTALTIPPATHELVDISTQNIIALVDASTFGETVSSYYIENGNNLSKLDNSTIGNGDPSVYIAGPITTYSFNRWNQPAYVQEVFRADNVYRRILAGINNSLQEGPSDLGIANIVETLFAQPYIPHDIWNDSDFRVFKPSIGQDYPKYYNETTSSYLSQYEGYPGGPPVVQAKTVLKPWSPTNITYNNQPTLETNLENTNIPTTTVEQLNNVTRFDISNELVRQLRLGFDTAEGGVINWNYANLATNELSGFYDNSEQVSQGINYNVFFLNNPSDSYAGLNLLYYALEMDSNGNAIGYRTFGPLIYNEDYYIDALEIYYDANTNTYNLPSDLLRNYAVNSNIPFVNPQPGTPEFWSGAGNAAYKIPPQFLVRVQLRKYTAEILNIADYIDFGSNFPVNVNDFLVYSYGQISFGSTSIAGNFGVSTSTVEENLVQYYDSESGSSLQPSDSPFGQGNNFQITSLAQSSFAKFESSSDYAYAVTMLGGNVQFSKTINVENLLQRHAFNDATVSSPCTFVMQGLQYSITNDPPTDYLYSALGTNQYIITGVVLPSTSNGQNRLPFSESDYCLVEYGNENNVLAVFDSTTYFRGELANLAESGAQIIVQGVVLQTYWNTRIPITNYRGDSPVFQAQANFPSQVTPFTPDQTQAIALENNFFVQILGLPLGVGYTITATWSFTITTTSSETNVNPDAIGFPNTKPASTIQEGIMQLFTGNSVNTLRTIDGNIVDVDGLSDGSGVVYEQVYVSPTFSGWFLNYKDYVYFVNPAYGGTKLGNSDINAYDTLTNPYIPGETNINTVVNIFSPRYGFVSLSILPNMFFSNPANGNAIDAVRINNNGFALQMNEPSFNGLVFYGKNANKVIDKPTRLVVDFSYALADLANRKKIIDIEDNGYAAWVNASEPDTVMDNSTFFVTGSQFKYAHKGFDQAENQYNDTFVKNESFNQGDYYDTLTGNIPMGLDGSKNLVNGSFYGYNSTPPAFETDSSILPNIANPITGIAQTQFRYRNSNIQPIETGGPVAAYSYYNLNAEKISYLQFDLSSFPVDTVINQAFIEVYFASGFTIKEGKNTNFTLNKNIAWEQSRLSGNGLMVNTTASTTSYPLTAINSPLNNVHWRKNFFEILLPYAFMSEPQDFAYGIRNIFGNTSTQTPAQNQQPNLEYLGFVNIDEIDTSSLTGTEVTNFTENTVGLANVILTQSSIIYTVNGILTFNEDQTLTGLNVVNPSSPGTTSAQPILQQNLLPNQKVLLFPYGYDSTLYYYGYVKSAIPSQLISFDDTNISIYQKALNYVVPIYSQYVVRLLEADTYFPYSSFSSNVYTEGSVRDISV